MASLFYLQKTDKNGVTTLKFKKEKQLFELLSDYYGQKIEKIKT